MPCMYDEWHIFYLCYKKYRVHLVRELCSSDLVYVKFAARARGKLKVKFKNEGQDEAENQSQASIANFTLFCSFMLPSFITQYAITEIYLTKLLLATILISLNNRLL